MHAGILKRSARRFVVLVVALHLLIPTIAGLGMDDAVVGRILSGAAGVVYANDCEDAHCG